MKKEDKALLIDSLVETINNYPHFYIVDVTALNSQTTSELRRECFKNEIKLQVVKNTLFIKALEKAEPGKTYIFIDHPAYNDSEMETVMHVGYEDVAVDRQGVTDLLKSPEVLEAIKAKGIKLLSFKEFFEAR